MNVGGPDPAPSDPQVKEQRLLAAIVFTDVVGFSRLAAKNEARVYVALQRDMGVMTDLCRAHGGAVLNTMGDGMLMSFPSAVDAMACAVEIQQTLANKGMSLPAVDVLHHRIGVHLGDVIVKGDNVFGDGVNVAARLQTDARPDSIWYSHTVHEVIKNKLKFDSRYVGQRQFKNLGEPIKVWEVPPLAEVAAKLQADAAGLNPTVVVVDPQGAQGGKAVMLVLVSVLLVASVIFLISRIKTKTDVATPPDAASIKRTQDLLDRLRPNDPKTTQDTTAPTTPTLTDQQALTQLQQLKDSYRFAEAVTFLSGDGKIVPNSSVLVARYSQLALYKAWLETQLAKSTASEMIHVSLSGGEGDIYNTPNGVEIQFGSQGFQPLTLSQLAPKDFEALATSVEQWRSADQPPQLSEWHTVFQEEYSASTR
ncbi:hypothetical protein BH11ARM1_BH11ARM1_06340 [soil metagenome]